MVILDDKRMLVAERVHNVSHGLLDARSNAQAFPDELLLVSGILFTVSVDSVSAIVARVPASVSVDISNR